MNNIIEIGEDLTEAKVLLENTTDHIFLTGNAGAGKTTLMKEFIKNHFNETLVCASTGVAAVNIGGVTIHKLLSFPGIPIGYKQVKKLDPRNNEKDRKRYNLFKKAKYILIDEISMVRADLMDQISWFFHKNFPDADPFGGKKLIMVGDINQLPPVVSSDHDKEMMNKRMYKSPYFFDAACWNPDRYSTFKIVKLTKIWRQSDPYFIELLNDIKDNNISPIDIDRLNAKCYSTTKDNGGVMLCSTNKIANETNTEKLKGINEQSIICMGDIEGEFPESSMPVAKIIELKPGCRVMTTVNSHNNLFVNGSIGTFIGKDEETRALKIIFDNEHEETIVGKCIFENIDYVYNEDEDKMESKVIGKFIQYPIKLAYALTIHKSQGQTFDKVIIDLGERGAFAHGQTYVALSRCKSIEGIILRRPINPKDFIFDRTVLEFNKNVTA